jgi:nucleoside-diphosphate-sugar epimerase
MSRASGQCQRVLVTGATGFVGGEVVRRARAQGIIARSLARRSIPSLNTPDDYVLCDWTAEQLGPVVAGMDAVIHCASVVHKPGAPSEEYTRFNVDVVRALGAACKAQAVPRIVYLSTIKVYGESPLGKIDEATPVAPESAYARTKLEAEYVLKALAAQAGPEIVILRLCPVFGVGDKGNVRTMIRAIARRRFAVPGDGSHRKSLVHVSSVAEVALAACRRGSGVFVVADRDVPSVAQLSDTIARALDRSRPLRIPAAALYLAAAGCELGFRVLRREPRIHRGLIRKALLPSECDPMRVLSELEVDCHRDLRQAIGEEVDWLRNIGEI